MSFKSQSRQFRYFTFALAIVSLIKPVEVDAQPITRPISVQVSGQAFVDHDFITLQKQGDALLFKSSNPYDFTTHPDSKTPFSPAPFNYDITTSSETIAQCSIEVIAWGQPIGVGRSGRGFLGRISVDKTVVTGSGVFKAAKSAITVNYNIDGGRPPSDAVFREIISTANNPSPARVIPDAEAKDLWGLKSHAPFITGLKPGQSAKWISRSGPPDDFYTVYSLPCSEIINIPPAEPKLPGFLIGLGTLALLGLAGLMLFRRAGTAAAENPTVNEQGPFTPQAPQMGRPSKPLERPENGGAVFAASPMQAANVAAPLSPAGQLTASNLQMLTGPYKVLRPAYHATGRIGYAQEGVPTAADYSFGTGFLVTPNHVITNRHVHGFYGHYLTSEEDCGGIEFIAEKDKDASDFIPFNGQPPLLVDGLDIAIYTLSRPAENRTPIDRVAIPTQKLDARDIAVIGYPDTHEPDDPDLLAAFEEDPVFAVKRISQGHIFQHSTDTESPYGVETRVDEDEVTSFAMQAICHNASTLSGNSGSPILDLKTGDLLGVHFAGYKIFNKREAANLAIAIAQLTEHPHLQDGEHSA